jgi:hypothetical protein
VIFRHGLSASVGHEREAVLGLVEFVNGVAVEGVIEEGEFADAAVPEVGGCAGALRVIADELGPDTERFDRR